MRNSKRGCARQRETAVARVVTYASATGAYGGPFDTAMRQAEIVSAAGFRVVVIAGTSSSDRPVHTGLAPTRFVSVKRVFPVHGFVGLFSVQYVRTVVRAIGSSSAVHISIAREMIPMWALIVAVLRRKRVVLQPHGMLTSGASLAHRMVDLVLRPFAARADCVICLTDVEAHEIRLWFRKRVPPLVVLGNPAPLILPKRQDSSGTAEALFLGRLHPRKRVDVFAEASERASNRGWTDTYTVVGPDEGELAKLRLDAGGQRGNLRYEGAIPGSEVAERVNRAAVFVLPSWREPWGNVLIAALSLGKPVVVTSSAALATQIKQYDAGLIVEDGDAEDLAEAVHRILSDTALYKTLSEGASKFAHEQLSRVSQLEGLKRAYDL